MSSSPHYERPTDNVKLLIELVKSKPELYDPKNSLYTHRYAHANAWREVSATLKVPVYEFRSKWNSIRNSYVRMLRRRITNPSQPKWYLEDNMSFLKNILDEKKKKKKFFKFNSGDLADAIQRSTHSQLSNIKIINENIEFNDNCNIDIMSLRDSDNSEMNKIKKLNKSYNKTKRNLQEFDKIFDCLTNYLNNIDKKNTIDNNENCNNNNNETCSDLFFQSIKKDYEKLTVKKMRKFKLIVLNAITELLDDETT